MCLGSVRGRAYVYFSVSKLSCELAFCEHSTIESFGDFEEKLKLARRRELLVGHTQVFKLGG